MASIHQQRSAAQRMLGSMDQVLSIVGNAREDGASQVQLQRGFLVTLTHGPGYASDGVEELPLDIAERRLTDAHDAARALLDALPSHYHALLSRIEVGSLDSRRSSWLREGPGDFPAEGVNPDNVWRWMHFQRAKAQESFRDLDKQTEVLTPRLHRLRLKLLPRSLYVLLGILAGLLVAGVIAPMMFLSAKDDASRPLLMLLFVPLALAFVGFLVFELRRLRQAGDLSHDF